MPDLVISFQDLRDFAEALESIRTRMNATGQTFDNYEDDMGDGDVRDALQDFVDNWRDGRAEIDGQLTTVRDIAESIADDFEGVDTQYASDLREGAEGEGEGGGAQPA
ncbi:hypothetical protein [Streptomyces sp. 6N223]|uniref:hypothetical protein n=1 Tax=Streptomyces sp. 6N223 TaxID=3457412 RepID=UPI003FD3973F